MPSKEFLRDMIEILQEEIAELKKEKQEAMEPWLGDDWNKTTLADWADDIEKQKAEITKEMEEAKEELYDRAFEKGYDQGQLENSVDQEYLEEKDQEIEELQTSLEERADEVEELSDENEKLTKALALERQRTAKVLKSMKSCVQSKLDIIISLKEENKKLKQDTTCDFCDKERCVLTKRDAGYDEWTCAECHKEQYPEDYGLD